MVSSLDRNLIIMEDYNNWTCTLFDKIEDLYDSFNDDEYIAHELIDHNYEKWKRLLHYEPGSYGYLNSYVYDTTEFELDSKPYFSNMDKPMKMSITNVNENNKYSYEQWSDNWYEKQTKTLKIPCNYDNPLPCLPLGIKIIEFLNHQSYTINNLYYSIFNQNIDDLPNTLEKLSLSDCFNLPVDHLPSSLLYLKFGYRFNQEVNFLPSSLTHLIFGWKFNQQINNLPISLVYLSVGYKFNQCNCLNKIPPNIKVFGIYYNNPQINFLLNSFQYNINHSIALINYEPFINIFRDETYYKYDLKPIENIPINLKLLIINIPFFDVNSIKKFIRKVPFGCKIVNGEYKEINWVLS